MEQSFGIDEKRRAIGIHAGMHIQLNAGHEHDLRMKKQHQRRRKKKTGHRRHVQLTAKNSRVARKLHCPFGCGRISETRFRISAETFSMSSTMEFTRLTR